MPELTARPPLTPEQLDMQARMAALMDQLAPQEGHTYPGLEGVKLMRATQSLPRTPVLYEPCMAILFQGRKTCYLGDQDFTYDAQHFLVKS